MTLDCGHSSETGFLTTRGLLCFWCAVRPSCAARQSWAERADKRNAARAARARRRVAIAARRAFYETRREKRAERAQTMGSKGANLGQEK